MRLATAEQVWIDLEPAQFGSRCLAYVLDFGIRWGVALIVIAALLFLFPYTDLFPRLLDVLQWGTTEILGVAALALFAFEWAYFLYFEVVKEGVTPGKRLVGLRVVDLNGLPITVRASFLRTVLIAVDIVGFGLPALISITCTQKKQRLGDLLAGTLVIHDTWGIETSGDHERVVTLDPKFYATIAEYLARRDAFSNERREAISSRIANRLAQLGEERPTGAGVEAWITEVFSKAKPGKKIGTSIKDDIAVEWSGLGAANARAKALLEQLRSGQLLSAELLKSIASEYQSLCQRYAYFVAFYPDTPQARATAALVRYGRRVIYGKGRPSDIEPKEPFRRQLEKSFLLAQPYVVLSFALLVLGALFAATLVTIRPSLALGFLSEQTLHDLEQGKIWTDSVRGLSMFSSSLIIKNNITVSLTAFALGITGGIGSMAIMLFNGVHLGAIFTALGSYGMSFRLLDFIVAHGVLELSIIIVAGGCGIALGEALIRPGFLSRSQALRNRAHDLVPLLVFSAACLLPAGLLEGFVSPYEHPFWIKLMLGLAAGGGYWSILLARRGAGPTI